MTSNSRTDFVSSAAVGDLKRELGIVDSHDGSPHRFFDWEQDPAESDSFLTIEEQIRLRHARLKHSQQMMEHRQKEQRSKKAIEAAKRKKQTELERLR